MIKNSAKKPLKKKSKVKTDPAEEREAKDKEVQDLYYNTVGS